MLDQLLVAGLRRSLTYLQYARSLAQPAPRSRRPGARILGRPRV